MNVIKSIIFLLLYALINQAGANENVNNYENAYSKLYLEYQNAHEMLNKKVEKCSLKTAFNYNFDSLVDKIPKGLSKQQLNAALYILKKMHGDKCTSSAVGIYVSKASDLKRVIKIVQREKINIKSSDSFKLTLTKINETEELLFYTPASYFQLLSQYQSISAADRKKLESIKELQSNYNMVKLVEALQKYYSY